MNYMIAIAILMIGLTGCATGNVAMENDAMQKQDVMQDEMMENDAMQKQDVMQDEMVENDAMEKHDSMQSFSGDVLAGTTTKYLEFNKVDYEMALENDKVILLYFYANWCPTCKAEQERLMDAFEDLDDENIVGFRVNYKDSNTDDLEQELAKEYGITYQHTKVILKDGERVLKAPDSWDADRYKTELMGV